MNRTPHVVFLASLLLPAALLCAAQPASSSSSDDRSWSAALLRQVWNEPSASTSSRQTASEGLSLRSYQLRHLRVGEAGRSQNLISLLQKIVPPGSSLKPDSPANTLHILTTPTAHAAIWDLLSSLDQPDPQSASNTLSPDLQHTLTKLANSPVTSDAILSQIRELRTQVDRQTAQIPSDKNRIYLIIILISIISASVLIFSLFRKYRNKQSSAPTSDTGDSSAALALSPEKISAALAPLQQQWQQEVMGSLNQAAIRLEAWYQEQKFQKERLEQLAERQQSALVAAQTALSDTRAQWLSETQTLVAQASGRFESVAERLEAQTSQLNAQNDRVEALANELSHTVQELDRTKDEILRLEAVVSDKNAQLDATRAAMANRERQLVHEQARIAALSLLLEEGGDPETLFSGEKSDANDEPPADMPSPSPESSATPQPSCPTPNTTPFRFQFLHPDHPVN